MTVRQKDILDEELVSRNVTISLTRDHHTISVSFKTQNVVQMIVNLNRSQARDLATFLYALVDECEQDST